MQNVYFFGDGTAEGGASMQHLLGGKGANLGEMTNIGIPVPPGFTIPTAVCVEYLSDGCITDDLRAEVVNAMSRLEGITGKRFGDGEAPARPRSVGDDGRVHPQLDGLPAATDPALLPR